MDYLFSSISKRKKEDIGVFMFENKSQFVSGSNEDFAAESFLILHGNNIEYSDKQDIVTNMKFEAISTSIKKYFFHQRMVDFLNALELSDNKYHTNGNVGDENYKRNVFFPM